MSTVFLLCVQATGLSWISNKGSAARIIFWREQHDSSPGCCPLSKQKYRALQGEHVSWCLAKIFVSYMAFIINREAREIIHLVASVCLFAWFPAGIYWINDHSLKDPPPYFIDPPQVIINERSLSEPYTIYKWLCLDSPKFSEAQTANHSFLFTAGKPQNVMHYDNYVT